MAPPLASQTSSRETSPVSKRDEERALRQAHGTDYATDGTDISTPNNSDPHVTYDSPNFVLPEIDEICDSCFDDDQTNVSTMSRMSAPFVQFSPSIQQQHESDLARMGLSTVEAANKPCDVQCLTSVNFMSEESVQHDALPPMQVQVMRKTRVRPQRKGSIGQGSCSDDSSGLFSIRSEPTPRRSQNSIQAPSSRNHLQRRSAPPPIPKQILEKKCSRRDASVVAPATTAPKRSISLTPPGRSDDQHVSHLECIAAEVSRVALKSAVADPIPFGNRRGFSFQPKTNVDSEAQLQSSLSNGLSVAPNQRNTAKDNKKERKSVFEKMFSNQVQADFDEDLVVQCAARAQRRYTDPFEYGVAEEDFGHAKVEHRQSSMVRSANSSSQRSFGELSTRSKTSTQESPDATNPPASKTKRSLFRRKAKEVDVPVG